MMTLTKLAISAALICGVSACSATVDQGDMKVADVKTEAKIMKTTPVDTKIAETKTKTHGHRTTVKPGADVTINTVLPKSMTSGSYQTVQLQFKDGYSDGILSVKLVPSNGLDVFGGSSAKTFNMAVKGPHKWDVDVKADVDGVYFLNVFATAKGRPRSFSVRLNMGQVTQKMFDDVMPADGELAAGGKIRALEADETIK